jgi:putative oxidoreductase
VKARSFVKKTLTHPYVALLFRLCIGGIFIYASMYKINYPAEFAEAIANYQIVPYWSVNVLAVVLPWVELVSGVLLIAGIRSRAAASVIGLLTVFFTVAVFVNLMRDAPIDCGCFQYIGDKISWRTFARDVILIIMITHVLFFDRTFHLENRFSIVFKEI